MKKIKHFIEQKYSAAEIIMLGLISLTPLIWLSGGWIILGHDSGFRPNIQHHLEAVWHGWYQTVNTGLDWSLFKGFLITQFPELLFQSMFHSLEKAQVIVLPLWFFVMAMGMYICVRGFFPEKKYWFIRLYTSLFWVFNFFILQAWGIAERAKFSLYAALPISILLLSKTFQRKIPLSVSGILFGLLYFFLNGGGSPPLFGASVVVWIITTLYWTLANLRAEKWRSIARGAVVFSWFLFCFILSNSYWLLVEGDLYRGTYSFAINQQGGVDGLLAWEQTISKNASLINLIRLQGIPDWYDNVFHPFSKIYLQNLLFICISFFPISIVIIGIVFLRKNIAISPHRHLVLLSALLLVVGLFFAAGSHPPTGVLYMQMMKRIPGFAVFRSSFYKFAPVVWFSIIFLSGYFLQIFIFAKPRKYNNILAISILIGLLLYHYPFFSTSFFRLNPNFSTRIQIPPYVLTTGSYLDTMANNNGRILLVPELDRGYINEPIDTYTWGFYSLDILPRLVTTRDIIANDSRLELVQALYDALYENKWNEFYEIAKILGISQILYRGDTKSSEGPSSRVIAHAVLDNQFGLPVFVDSTWRVYTIGNNKPNLQVETNIHILLGNATNESELLSNISQTVISMPSQEYSKFKNSNFSIQAECLYCVENEYEKLVDTIVFPKIDFLPGSFLYPFFGRRKIPQPNPNSSDKELVDVFLSRSMFRISEYNQLKLRNDPWEMSMQDYQLSLSTILETYNRLDGRDRIIYANRLHAYLLKQHELFANQKVDPPIQLTNLQHAIQPFIWKSEANVYRFLIDVPNKNVYTVNVSEKITNIMLDNTEVSIAKPIELTSGIHLLQIRKSEVQSVKKIPILFLTTYDTTKKIALEKPSFSILSTKPTETVLRVSDSSIPYVIISPVTYDERWQATIINGKGSIVKHVLANGYANAWIVNSQKEVDIKIEYSLQKRFFQGLWISGISILLGVCYILTYLRNRLRYKKI